MNYNDVLDYTGKNDNFINNQEYSEEYKELGKKWSQLPMYADKKKVKEFFELLESKQVILLVSGTGSGKTVLVPKFVLKYFIHNKITGKIAVTNPKSLTTKYNAEYGAKTLDIELGQEVGYKYKGAPKEANSDNTKLLYATDGIILATILSNDPLLKDYNCVIIDEAHERGIQIDLLLKLLKEVVNQRKDFKLIIMSATINSKVFKDYYNIKGLKYGELEVTGESNFKIHQHWANAKDKISRSNYVNFAVERCIKIIESEEPGDIIVFVAITSDAVRGCDMLRKLCPEQLKMKDKSVSKKLCDETFCIEVYSKMKAENKELAVHKDLYKKGKYTRKVIFATNVAESSITFDGLVFVIDSGYELANFYNYKDNSYVISKMLTSQAQVKQRIGRAGRTQKGVSYHLYTEEDFKKMNKYPQPNISVTDLTDFILSFLKYSENIKLMLDVVQDLITVPNIKQVTSALYKLHFMKAIKVVTPKNELLSVENVKWKNMISYDQLSNYLNGTITRVGINLLHFKSSPVISAYTILLAKYMDCVDEIVTLMGIIEICESKIDSLFYSRKDQKGEMIRHFSKYSIPGSDHLTILNIYQECFLKNETLYLNLKLFSQIKDRIYQLKGNAERIAETEFDKYINIKTKPYENIIDNILFILGYSHYFNLIKKDKTNYKTLFYLENSEANIEFSDFVSPIASNIASDYAICQDLSNAFGNPSFKCVTQIPQQIINNLNKEDLPFINKI